jgi:hypothetical protein
VKNAKNHAGFQTTGKVATKVTKKVLANRLENTVLFGFYCYFIYVFGLL